MDKLNRRSFLKSAAVGGVLIASGEAFAGEPVRGLVTAKGKSMSGVVVADGLVCAETATALTLDAENGRLYVGTARKALFSLDPRSGTVNWRTEDTGAPYLASATVSGGRLFTADHTGRVRCFA